MARTRQIKPEFFDDSIMASCTPVVRLFFVGLWTQSDRNGIFEWDPPRLRKVLFGFDDFSIKDVSSWLDDLLVKRRICSTMVHGKRYGKVVNFEKHQWFHHQEKGRDLDINENTFSFDNKHLEKIVSVLPRANPGLTLDKPRSNPPITDNCITITDNRLTITSIPDVRCTPVKPRASSSQKSTTPVAQVRDAWLIAYKQKYTRDCINWGAREGGAAKSLLASWPLQRVIELIGLFFEWPMSGVVNSGHAFCKGYNSFTERIHELDADTHSLERREEAAIFKAQLNEMNNRTIENWAKGEIHGLPAKT